MERTLAQNGRKVSEIKVDYLKLIAVILNVINSFLILFLLVQMVRNLHYQYRTRKQEREREERFMIELKRIMEEQSWKH